MKHRLSAWGIATVFVLIAAGFAETTVASAASTARLEATVRYLADDAREGRGPGTAGLDSSSAYIGRQFAAIGLRPAFDGSYSQAFPDSQGHTLHNIVGVLDGDPGEEHLIIGAHYDHLGLGEDPANPVVFNGADDNASGVAALIEVAGNLIDTGERPARTLVFAAFSGEEQGMLGARHYADHPALPLTRTRAMLNLDTVGRLRNGRLIVFGTGTADLFDKMLDGINLVFRFDLIKNREGVGAGDHTVFFEKGIPVLHLFTDAHLDYHQPTDDADKIDFEGLARVTEFATEIVTYLSDASVPLRFIPAGAEKLKAPSEGSPRRVSLGTIPDFGRESGGVLLSGVVPGSAAESVGLQKGDLIVEIDGTPVDNLYDYSAALKTHAPGDVITIGFVRDGEKLTVEATLTERR